MVNFLDERLPMRFWDKVTPEPMSGCWLWTGAHTSTGYGQVRVGGRRGRCLLAHRHLYETLIAAIPAGLELDHRCSQRCCVNPAHIEAVTHLENIRRSSNARKTHCPSGHEFTAENTIRDPWRKCRKCKNARDKIDSRARRAA